MTPGNHDFNYGSLRLSELAGVASGKGLDIISSNIFNKADGLSFLPTTKIVEIDGVKVGFLGLTTLETPILTSPAGVASIEFRAYKASAEAAIAALKANGADVIVALTHISRAEIETLVKALDIKPDVVIEGHDHVLGSIVVDGVLIAGAGQYQENLGLVSITIKDGEITDKTAKIITKADASDVEGDADVKALAENMKAAVEAEFSVIVAQSEVLLSSARGTDDGTIKGVRNSEQALGNLVADAMRVIGDADIAVTNGGGLRADIRIGSITKGDINAVLPFGNVLVVKEVTPKALKEILEVGLSTLPATHGRFPQISGMSVIYDPELPINSRVISISVGGAALDLSDDTTIYKMATNDFMAVGGDGYTVIAGLATVAELDSLDDMLITYVTKILDRVIKSDNAKIDGRLNVYEEPVIKNFTVTFVGGEGYEYFIFPNNSSSSFPEDQTVVDRGSSLQFNIRYLPRYTENNHTNVNVYANGEKLTYSGFWYVVRNIQEDIIITVDPIEKATNKVIFRTAGTMTLAKDNNGLYFQLMHTLVEETMPVTTLEDHFFKGWYLDAEFNQPVVYPYDVARNTTVWAKFEAIESPAVTLVRAVATAKDFISILETSKNSNVWVLSFKVTETYSDGTTRIVPYAIQIKANNANIDGKYNLGSYTLLYDIKGNGSNIKEFRVVMN